MYMHTSLFFHGEYVVNSKRQHLCLIHFCKCNYNNRDKVIDLFVVGAFRNQKVNQS